ncbi:hypothetical protein JOF48_001951 [Arthrobacter stackebrandtii]|uniref:Uncharacterized protein n=1 Tax=Arthrobacter stackebrandtii TaxID=272161 RepID=A0ABS4YWI5_9MICC|nr:DUF6882 domain-containing protein [Arthrobacter stackebrandtii]MBP2413152.1 hypothetical protein [Arthrobacter stackebrandtii]PYH01089.1 hypothetical protein CVV67_05675 [Arthrobacter stackebrandtii]
MGIFAPRKKATPEAYIAASVEAMAEVQQIHMNTWGMNRADCRWDVDMNLGKVSFMFPDKLVTADIQVVGTLFDGTFMWGWDHPSVPAPLRFDALAAREWGAQNSLPQYTQLQVPADMDAAWEFTAVAARQGNAAGTYSGQAGTARVFLTFGKLTMTSLSAAAVPGAGSRGPVRIGGPGTAGRNR